jgi:thiol-disulfide isomerase/thioredoxin
VRVKSAFLFVLAALLASSPQPAPPEPALSWLDREGSVKWGVTIETATAEAEAAPSRKLTAPAWAPSLPSLDLEWLDRAPLSADELAGKVVLLEFWATWCRPCLEQLPRAQALYDAERERGFLAIAINAHEPADAVQRYVRSLGLTMPVARDTTGLAETLGVKALPTALLVDRRGRIRARFDGQPSGGAEQIARLARELVAQTEEPRQELAELRSGAELLQASWTRELPATVQGLAIGTPGEGEPWIWISAGGALWTLSPDGGPAGELGEVPLGSVLRALDVEGDGKPELLAFRLTETRVVGLASSLTGFDLRAPAAVLDIVPVPGGLLLGTVAGLVHAELSGGAPRPLGELGTVSDLAWLASENQLAALETGRALHWIAPDLSLQRRVSIPPAGAMLVTGPGVEGVGIAATGVIAAATGRFLGGAGTQAALATAAGELLLVDLEAGAVLSRARWRGLTHLAAIDAGRDGRDELLVVSGRRLSLVRIGAL